MECKSLRKIFSIVSSFVPFKDIWAFMGEPLSMLLINFIICRFRYKQILTNVRFWDFLPCKTASHKCALKSKQLANQQKQMRTLLPTCNAIRRIAQPTSRMRHTFFLGKSGCGRSDESAQVSRQLAGFKDASSWSLTFRSENVTRVRSEYRWDVNLCECESNRYKRSQMYISGRAASSFKWPGTHLLFSFGSLSCKSISFRLISWLRVMVDHFISSRLVR